MWFDPLSTQRKIIYKYVGMEGARAILKNRTLRFARPSEMNDPFDIYIDDLFEISVAELFHRHRLEFVELLARKPQKFAEILGEDSAQMEFFSKLITTSPPEKRTELEALLTDRNIEAL